VKKEFEARLVDFTYEISDERLLAYSSLPIFDRLRWLDEIRRFTLAVRAAPEVAPLQRSAIEGTEPSLDRASAGDSAGSRRSEPDH